jgi:hypothetical protein
MKNTWDKSTKKFEVQVKHYIWDKYSRVLKHNPKWLHYRYYNTYDSGLDALRDFRRSIYDKWYYDYPGADREKEFPNIKPTINIKRYRLIERDI